MANLTAAQYQAEMDSAFTKYGQNNFYNVDRGVAWAQIASVFAHLWTHQKMFDAKGVVPSSVALGYRTKAEGYLAQAKTWAGQASNSPPACAATQAASTAAYAYCQLVKVENEV